MLAGSATIQSVNGTVFLWDRGERLAGKGRNTEGKEKKKKKIISIVALILLVAMLGVILIASTPKTIEDAKAKFEKKGYDVSTRTGKKVPSYYPRKV